MIDYLLLKCFVMDKEELKNRTKKFAHRCVKLALSLPNSILGRHLQNQLIRSSTSVAAITGQHVLDNLKQVSQRN